VQNVEAFVPGGKLVGDNFDVSTPGRLVNAGSHRADQQSVFVNNRPLVLEPTPTSVIVEDNDALRLSPPETRR
jgi:hypothetical protein